MCLGRVPRLLLTAAVAKSKKRGEKKVMYLCVKLVSTMHHRVLHKGAYIGYAGTRQRLCLLSTSCQVYVMGIKSGY